MTPDRSRLAELLRMRCPYPDVLSVYFRLDPDPAGLRGVRVWLDAALARLAEDRADEMDATRRRTVATDMEAVRRVVERAREWQGRGIALFAAGRLGLFDVVELPCTPSEVAVLDVRPYVRPLLAVTERGRPYCVAVVDTTHSWVATSRPGGTPEDTCLTTAGPRKPRYGGWHGLLEYRTRNHAEHVHRRHLRETADLLRRAICERGADLLVIGGHEHMLPRFLAMLPADLRARLAGTFVIDPHTMTAARACALAEEVTARFQDDCARHRVRSAVDEHAAGGLVAAGLAECLEAVGERAVERLFVRTDDRTGGFACDRCGVVSLDDRMCGVCGGKVRAVPDVIAEAIALVLTAGGDVDQVPEGTPLDGPRAVARLRFPVAVLGSGRS